MPFCRTCRRRPHGLVLATRRKRRCGKAIAALHLAVYNPVRLLMLQVYSNSSCPSIEVRMHVDGDPKDECESLPDVAHTFANDVMVAHSTGLSELD
ncbi:hypothetical protein P389DRAFT_65340 [Cystobasidium minutum MCA 4210]|uniref:uncharacterized protein n=1 Tax=Cystobasidium minutum MCA 4210 TaxID=1397322 RepID=UPI0034CDD98A|eukprot:jgi/Rhomi1/65340/CE65339_39